MNHIFELEPCEHCIFNDRVFCIAECYALHGEYKLTNVSLNFFYRDLAKLDTQYTKLDTYYKGKHDCKDCKYSKNVFGDGDYFFKQCEIDKIYYNSVPFDCLYLDDDGKLSNFGKQVMLNRKL